MGIQVLLLHIKWLHLHFLGLVLHGLHLCLERGLELGLHVESDGGEVAGRLDAAAYDLVKEGGL